MVNKCILFIYTEPMDYLLLGIASVVIIALLMGAVKYYKNQKFVGSGHRLVKQGQPSNVKCPICQTILFKGENLISKVYRPMNVPDQLMTVAGCPHCYPACEPGVKRICPVCHKPIPQDGTLTARLFNKSAGKKHVHIVGCSNCHKPVAK